MDLRRWWVLLNWALETECVRGNTSVCVCGDESERGVWEMHSMNKSSNKGEAISGNEEQSDEFEAETRDRGRGFEFCVRERKWRRTVYKGEHK